MGAFVKVRKPLIRRGGAKTTPAPTFLPANLLSLAFVVIFHNTLVNGLITAAELGAPPLED